MDKFGIIGDPIKGSLSPILFKAGYNGKYVYDLIEGSDFEESFDKFIKDYQAINVTAPFKEQAFHKILELAKDGKASISGPCLRIGATNLLVKNGNEIEAYNSDFTGIILSIADAVFPGIVNEFYQKFGTKAYIKVHQYFRQSIDNLYSQKPQALIVGCGGAGRAAAVAAAELGYSTALMNRTPEKAQKICLELLQYDFINVPISDFKASFKECDLVIYTLPMKLSEIDELTKDDFYGEDRYENNRTGKILFEANYKNPAFNDTTIREKMYLGGCQYIPGIKWLVLQALTGYGLMTKDQPSFEAMAAAIV